VVDSLVPRTQDAGPAFDTVRAPSWRGTPADLARLLDTELSGSLNTRRTVLRVLDLARSHLADWAMLALVEPKGASLDMYGGSDPTFAASTRHADAWATLRRVMDGGQHELLHVDLSRDPHAALAGLVPHPQMRDEVAGLRPADILAMPLNARGGLVGALVLVRGEGGGFTPDDVARISELCARSALALDSARVYEDHARVTRILEDSLRPPALPELPGLDVAACFRSAAAHLAIGGDFYDVHGSDDDWLVVLGDVCGKGVEAAVLNGRARQSIRTAARFDRRPSRILSTLNEVLYEDDSDRFVTVACARVRPAEGDTHRVDLAVAGHPAPMLIHADGTVEQPEVTGRLAGALPTEGGYQEVTLTLGPGDALLLFSDGIHEARGEGGLYGLDRLRTLLGRYAGTGATTIVEAVERDVVEHLDGNGHDDMTALAIAPHRRSS
jgi:sigma-B regulation protein RsbU (phosphoserine phosphatase)